MEQLIEIFEQIVQLAQSGSEALKQALGEAEGAPPESEGAPSEEPQA